MTGKGSKELEKEVLIEGLCSGCGACIEFCPYIDFVNDHAVIIEHCGLSEGKCYDLCPMTYVIPHEKMFGPQRDVAFGPNISIIAARAKDLEIRSTAQYGGAVSALVAYAIDSSEIDDAILTKYSDNLVPMPVIATDKEEVLICTGSKYTPCPVLSGVNKMRERASKICIVGTPCQVIAARKMQRYTGRIKLIIGLFCTWILSYGGFYEYLNERMDIESIIKFEIPPPPEDVFIIRTKEGEIRFPLEDIRRFILPACKICADMTSESADISVGRIEGMEGWNMMMTRTHFGDELVQNAEDAGMIEVKTLEEERIEDLREASMQKKRKAHVKRGDETG
jgi:coenzyme F420 hydrogenase subunit beta